MKAPNECVISINLRGIEANKPISFPWTDTIEGKTIVGVETFTRQDANNPSLSRTPEGSPVISVGTASVILMTFKNKQQLELLSNMPYLALRRTGTFKNFPDPLTQTKDSRSLRPLFAFEFSSKDSYLIYCAPNPPRFIENTYAYFVFKYL
jgi:hypothetical protein